MGANRNGARPTREAIYARVSKEGGQEAENQILVLRADGRFLYPPPASRRSPSRDPSSVTEPVPKSVRRNLCRETSFGRPDI